MGTVVTIDAPHEEGSTESREVVETYLESAMEWFHRVEAACTRFDPDSELMQLTARAGAPAPAGPILFEAVRFALAVAEETGGAFDPTVGDLMVRRGFDRNHRSGEPVLRQSDVARDVTFRDVHLDEERHTIRLDRPLTLDLGAVAKGLAVDLAVRELARLQNFAIDAGGDLFLSGSNAADEPWAVGIRHPRLPDGLLETWRVSDVAVCTSGDYLRRSPVHPGDHHIVDPRSAGSAHELASVTVVADSAMLADAFATAAFVLGPVEGLRWLERQEMRGLLVTPALECFATQGFDRDSTILPNTQGTADHHPGHRDRAGADPAEPSAGRDSAR